jgi:DNA replication ATP-dependent helicase Dna2
MKVSDVEEFRQSLVEHLQVELESEQREEARRESLGLDQLIEEGWALEGDGIELADDSQLRVPVSDSISKIRPGDRVKLKITERAYPAEVTSSAIDEVVIRPLCEVPRFPADAAWSLQALAGGTAAIFLQAMHRLAPGKPGWGHLAQFSRPSIAPAFGPERGSPLAPDSARNRAFSRCISIPRVFGVQGPPGTGKTHLLAEVALALSDAGRRIAVLAPTHQAVITALEAIRRKNREVRLVKLETRSSELARRSNSGIAAQPYLDGSRRSEVAVSSDTITGMTVAAAATRLILRRNPLAPHVLLIDESSQVPLAHAASLGASGAASLLFFGDDLQLPPIFAQELHDHRHSRSVFEHLRSTSAGDVETLLETHRMNDVLCQTVSRAFYEPAGVLGLHPSVDAHSRRLRLNLDLWRNLPKATRQALDPSAPFTWVEASESASSNSNAETAGIVYSLITAAIECGVSRDDIAVVVPYRRQARLIASLLADDIRPGVLDTVERVQGVTVELAILDLVVGCNVEGESRFVLNSRRLNVAASRARTKLIIIGTNRLLEETHFLPSSRQAHPGGNS